MNWVTVPSVTINPRWKGVRRVKLISLNVVGFLSCATKIDFMFVLTKAPDCFVVSISMVKVPFLLGRKHAHSKAAWRIWVSYIFRHRNLKKVREYGTDCCY